METTQLVWIIAVTVLTLLNIVWQFDLQTRMRRLQERHNRLFSGDEGTGLQMGLDALMDRLERMQGRLDQMGDLTQQLEAVVGHSVQGFGMVRFRAFQDTGGDQSFALVLVDGAGNGMALSALHSREGVRVYGKPLAAWTSVYNLSDEEKLALQQAREMVEGS